MIPWVTYGDFLNELIIYNEKKDSKLIYVNTIDNNIKTLKFLYKELTQKSKRTRNLMHISFNFHSDDKVLLTEKLYVSIVQDFLFSYGFPIDQPYIIYEHTDKNHPHLHIGVPIIKVDRSVINDYFSVKK